MQLLAHAGKRTYKRSGKPDSYVIRTSTYKSEVIMSPWSLLAVTALLGVVAIVIVVAKATSTKASAAIFGLACFAGCLLVNTKQFYLSFDATLGGHNHAYTIVQALWILAMFFMMISIARIRQSHEESRYTTMNVALAVGCIAAVAALLFITPMEQSVYRMEPYRNAWTAIVALNFVNLYSLGCAVVDVKRAIALYLLPEQPRLRRAGYAILAGAFTLGIITVAERLVTQTLDLTVTDYHPSALTNIDGTLIVVIGTLLPVGYPLLAIGKSRHGAATTISREEP
ncbi:hypothetical protein [Leifsonia xyli]|uniref:hypothetical protein n=1 Tax=Leifsonia xyli TaxID=1575 RepID=UPI00146FBCB2|nr:hypothetical protein [Leifsonia xyli]